MGFGGAYGKSAVLVSIKFIPILKINLTALARLAVLAVLSAARRLVILFLELVLQNIRLPERLGFAFR